MRLETTRVNLSNEVKKFLVGVVEGAVGDSIKEDIQTNRLIQPNSTPSRIWDYINRDIAEQSKSHGCLYNLTKRGPWTMCVIYDSSTNQVITLMREQRFIDLKREKKHRASMHYLDAFAQCLNSELCAPGKQKTFFDDEQRENSIMVEATNAVNNMTSCFNNGGPINHHILVLFTSVGYQLTSIRAVIIDSDFDIYDSLDLSQFISASESVVSEVVTTNDVAYTNPKRNLQLNAKAAQRKTTQLKIRKQQEQASDSIC